MNVQWVHERECFTYSRCSTLRIILNITWICIMLGEKFVAIWVMCTMHMYECVREGEREIHMRRVKGKSPRFLLPTSTVCNFYLCFSPSIRTRRNCTLNRSHDIINNGTFARSHSVYTLCTWCTRFPKNLLAVVYTPESTDTACANGIMWLWVAYWATASNALHY